MPESAWLTRRLFIGVVTLSLLFTSCLKPQPDSVATPEGAKRLLKLRGYDFSQSAFFDACTALDLVSVNAFLNAGIDPNARNKVDDRTPLINAAARGDLEVVAALLHGGADVNAKDSSGYTALFHALEARYDEVADVLIDQPGLDLNARGKNGVTVLMRYVWRDRPAGVKKLLKRGAAVDLQDNDGDAALHGAAQTGNPEVVKMLLESGGAPNVQNKVGGTPLMWAAVYGNEEAARILLSRGADPKLRDVGGVTALGWAERNKRSNLVQLLRK